MSFIEDVDYLKKNSIKQSYNILIDSKDRDRTVYPDPENYSIEFTTPFRNVIGIEVIDASIPKGMYDIDYNNNKFCYYLALYYNNNDNSAQTLKDKSIINKGFYYRTRKERDDLKYSVNSNLYVNEDKTERCYPNSPDLIILDYFEDGMPKVIYEETTFLTFEFEPANYIFDTNNDDDFVINFNKGISSFELNHKDINGDDDGITANTTIAFNKLTNTVVFSSLYPFVLDMNLSTMSEVIGFDTYITNNDNIKENKYRCNELYLNRTIDNYFKKLYTSNNVKDEYNPLYYSLKSPGSIYLLNNKYVILRCEEIEQHAYRSLSYSKYSPGIAKFRVNSLGYNDESVITSKLPLREFHPIGKLSRMTFRFETNNHELYDFKGINHHLVIGIYYYEPKILNSDNFISVLNPNYEPNFHDYKYYNRENDESDDEDVDEFSKFNLLDYKKKELLYSKDEVDDFENEGG